MIQAFIRSIFADFWGLSTPSLGLQTPLSLLTFLLLFDYFLGL
uniref:Uncharacterized protein n=1 Tax=Picea glauca TaxID=3330 RepID=A0A101LYV4_PICGL|nr:hypothetical protein ABT39_MTgene1460 [Picea glauca]KUM47909.1 hypothetical protein ABT39_MTgene4904 [Picea glauca]KUM47920.1 hypothetical protein ABT39_MTgene4915 [Picea glauca]